jgi:antitoxin component YwqK of YwqJK toxin-antitoxin module
MNSVICKDDLAYKACENSIITLKITGKTNEMRDIVDPNHAKFRAASAYVVDIEDFKTNKKMTEDISIHDSTFVYKVGEEVKVDEFDEDINEVCTSGIHYFKTREAAESWFLNRNPLHRDLYKDGLYRQWYSNGRLEIESTYKDRKLNGLHRQWTFSGQLWAELNYKDGILTYE